MIQRIQHLYLLFLVVLCTIFLNRPIVSGESSEESPTQYDITANGFYINQGSGIIAEFSAPSIFLWLILSLSFITIFLFRNLSLQKLLCYLNYLFISLFIIFFAINWISNINAGEYPINSISYLSILNIFLMFGLLLINYLAIRSIEKDEELIKASDRVR